MQNIPTRRLLSLVAGFAAMMLSCGDDTTTASDSDASSERAADEAELTSMELLGKRIFEDTDLSEPKGMSCASCHDPKQAFSGNNGSPISAISLGSRPEVFGNRNSPTASYAMFSPPFAFIAEQEDGEEENAQENEAREANYFPVGGQFWDGRADDLAEQAKGPFLNEREMNNPDEADVIEKVRKSKYAGMFLEVFGAEALDDVATAYTHLAKAIEAFEKTERFNPFSSKFDDFLRGTVQLTPVEAKGFELFKNEEKGNCIACHVGNEQSKEPKDWIFTDFTYDNLGIPRNAQIPDNAEPIFFDLGLCKRENLAEKAPASVDIKSLCGAFKVPTLRNVALTAPYGHNGFFTALRDIVRFYVTRDTNPESWYPTVDGAVQKFNDLPKGYEGNVNTEEPPYDRGIGEQPRLTEEEIDAVVAFLETLSDK
jgi:cytochrome c peroxidase